MDTKTIVTFNATIMEGVLIILTISSLLTAV
jgi:hypothetical protein